MSLETFDLLIIYNNGDERIIYNVNDYRIEPEKGVFVFDKNGYRHFVPIANVMYFGRYDSY